MTETTATPWPAGIMIRNVAGWFATANLAIFVIEVIISQVAPSLSEGGSSGFTVTLRFFWSALAAVVWFSLARERLEPAMLSAGAMALVIVIGILAVPFIRIQTGDTMSSVESLAIYGFGSAMIVVLGMTYREIRAEIDRSFRRSNSA